MNFCALSSIDSKLSSVGTMIFRVREKMGYMLTSLATISLFSFYNTGRWTNSENPVILLASQQDLCYNETVKMSEVLH
jgi:hypothetical protein